MKILLLLLVLLLPYSSAHAASYPSINLATGVLKWTWTTNGDDLTGFTVTCTNVTTGAVTVKTIANPAARIILLALIPVIAGTYSCTVNAYNGTETSAVLGPVLFRAFYCL